MIGPTCPKCGHVGHPTIARGRFDERAENPLGMGGLSVAAWENGATNTDGPRRCANTVIQGPRRSNKEID